MTDERPAASALPAALDWLTHPVTGAALLLLVVNDHLLKAAHGTWWTGKLSDVAWLIVAAPLLATVLAGLARVLRVRDLSASACAAASAALVGATFVLVKTTAAGAHIASWALTGIAGPSRVLADPTDLLALPALVLSWAVARSASRSGGHGRRRLRWMVLLPAVVLATAATSQVPPSGALQIAVVDGRLTVGDASEPGREGGSWYTSDDGEAWEATYSWSDDARQVTDDVAAAGGTLQTVCTEPGGDDCFRVATEGLGVDRSVDGGDTWQVDWAVPSEVLPQLAERYTPQGEPLRTVGVAILPTDDGYRVYAANGGDGLAVRDEQGAWTRIGFAYETDPDPVVPLPGEPTRLAHPVPVGVTLAVPAALAVLLLSRRRRHGRAPRPVRTGRWLAAGAGVLAAIALVANLSWSAVGGQEIASAITFGRLMAVLVVAGLVVTSSVLTAIAVGLLRGRAGWLIAVVAVGAAIVVELVSPTALAALTVAALIAGGALAVRWATRPDGQPRPAQS